jgi:natural product precursor
MKKLNKLTLNQETLRNLTSMEVKEVFGGAGTIGCTGQAQTCNYTACLGTCPPPLRPAE